MLSFKFSDLLNRSSGSSLAQASLEQYHFATRYAKNFKKAKLLKSNPDPSTDTYYGGS